MDDIRDSAAFAVSQLGWEKLKELQLKVITAFVASQNVFGSFQPAMGKAYAMHVYLYSSISLSDGRLTKIYSDCCNTINSYRGRLCKSSVVSMFYAIKVATIKSALWPLGHLLNQSTDFSFYLEISYPQPIQCIAESSFESLGSYIK